MSLNWTDLPQHITLLLVAFTRVGAVLMVLPFFSESAIPGQIRLLFALGLTLALFGLIRPALPTPPSDGTLALLIITEAVTGLAIGMIVRLFFYAITIAGSLASLQVGLTAAVVADQALGGPVPVLAKLATLAATLLCLSLGVHHMWLGAILDSYRLFPVGGLPAAADFATLAVGVAGQAMVLGVSLAAPIVIYGIVFNVALGLATRIAPTIQVFFLIQPLNLMLGLALVGITIGAMLLGFAEATAEFIRTGWQV
ncbi:flagellar biosynthetic protein FliR [Sphingorhabdus sp. M41]|uniref:flagellar biosynthetic protein FliR n=1 Tax=Sphingorhabdus sp. M41 TaxID=1806885 RepID=UPI00078CF6E0|nr:flagellar biosynthetic protein FliR [Sphingorhabdus sp. M41]AMO72617.1 flagellar biosynthetic protein FliR [Sphingorhabdus sp. M41]